MGEDVVVRGSRVAPLLSGMDARDSILCGNVKRSNDSGGLAGEISTGNVDSEIWRILRVACDESHPTDCMEWLID